MATYPSCIADSQLCSSCYASQSCLTCADGDSGNSCSAYCNSGCNTSCNSAQTFCNLGVQTIVNHSDVPAYPGEAVSINDIIAYKWTATFWNSLRSQLQNAATLGQVQNQGSIPSSDAVATDYIVTAAYYNQVVAMINFFNSSVSTAAIEDVIYATRAEALRTGYNTAKFNTTVCDICNAGNENRNDCNCSCDCDCGCSCDCDCSCPCDCDCACSCSCSCPGCSCSCSNSGET